jgi:hypothetical protein
VNEFYLGTHNTVERVLGELVSWSLAQAPALTPLIRKRQQTSVQFGIARSDRVLWVARTFKTTGTFFSVFGWGSSYLRNGVEETVVARLNEIRNDAPLRVGQDLRVSASDIAGAANFEKFTSLVQALTEKHRPVA